MKQIKFLMLAMMAFIASATFTACSSDDDNNNTQSNYEKYQQAVNQTVSNSDAILVNWPCSPPEMGAVEPLFM